MKATWRLRMAAAQREVWTGAQLRRLLAEKAGLRLSAASVSALLTKQPTQLKLDTLAALCTALESQRSARHRHHTRRAVPARRAGRDGIDPTRTDRSGQRRPHQARGQCSRCYQNDPAMVHRCAERLAAQMDPAP